MTTLNLRLPPIVTLLMVFLFCGSPFQSIAQINPSIDSIKRIFTDVNKPKLARIEAGYVLNITYSNISIDSQRLYSNQFYELVDSTNEEHQILELHLRASLAFSEGNPKETVYLLEKLLKINENPNELNSILSLLASSYHDLGLLNKALQAYQKLELEFGEKFYSTNMAITLYNMGDLKCDMNEKEEGLKLFEKARNILDSLDVKFLLGIIYNGIGSVYLDLKKSPEALEAFDNSIRIAQEVGSSSMEATAYLSKASLYRSNEQKQEEAFSYFEKALKIFETTGDVSGVAEVCGGLGDMYLKQNQSNLSLKNCKKALQINEEVGFLTGQIENCECLYNVYKSQRKYSEALVYHEKWKILNDSVFSAEKAKEIAKTELTFEFDKEKAILSTERQAEEAILKAETAQTRTAAAGIGALALLALGFFFNAHRNNKKIANQNEEISEKNTQLEKLNQTKDRIFAIIGHDLRKPVVAFNGISETINYLIKKEDYATLQQLGGEIEQDGFALQKLTDNLLNWALTQRDVMPYYPQEVNLFEKVAEVALIFEKVARDKNIELINTVPKDLKVFSDPNALLTILVNLTDNALKYTLAGGRVELAAANSTKGINIQVSDTGIGMSEEQVRDIFLLQKDKSQKGTGGEKGTGLGLHLVNELVKLNKGEIEAESKEGEGTTFRVLLPMKQTAVA